MPVRLTDHYDRSQDKQLLRGRIGYIKSWVYDDREDSEYHGGARYLRYPPKAVLVQYFTQVKQNGKMIEKPCQWKLDGMSEPGVYPIKPCKRSWALDQRRERPQLWVSRWQLPLAPAYSITAHGSQGQTLRAAIIDLQVGRGVSPIASYVSMTRIKTRSDLLIFRAFARGVFAQGPPEGPTLLLKKLRGEPIDWQAVEDRHVPSKKCNGPCLSIRFKEDYHQKEWRNKEDPHCKACIQRLQAQGKTHRCNRCRQWFPRTEFKAIGRHLEEFVCSDCNRRQGERRCIRCDVEKEGSCFPQTRWDQVAAKRVCLECLKEKRCSSCSRSFDVRGYNDCQWKRADTARVCRKCVPKRCPRCRKGKPKTGYSALQWRLSEGVAICLECNRKRCGKCNKEKRESDFDPAMWELADGSPKHCCKECISGRRVPGLWTCANKQCRQQKSMSEFSKAIASSKDGAKVKGNAKQCNRCLERRDEREAAMSQRSSAQVQKKTRRS